MFAKESKIALDVKVRMNKFDVRAVVTKKIVGIMNERGIGYEELDAMAGLPDDHFIEYTRGNVELTLEQFCAICLSLETTMSDLTKDWEI